jgi:hypothetical protein
VTTVTVNRQHQTPKTLIDIRIHVRIQEHFNQPSNANSLTWFSGLSKYWSENLHIKFKYKQMHLILSWTGKHQSRKSSLEYKNESVYAKVHASECVQAKGKGQRVRAIEK